MNERMNSGQWWSDTDRGSAPCPNTTLTLDSHGLIRAQNNDFWFEGPTTDCLSKDAALKHQQKSSALNFTYYPVRSVAKGCAVVFPRKVRQFYLMLLFIGWCMLVY